MDKDEFVKLLQHRRHDLVNELQVIHGYASMEMVDKVQDKLNHFLSAIEEERKLYMLQAPSFILWVEMFNSRYKNSGLTYTINEPVNLSAHDTWITNTCQKLIDIVRFHMDDETWYDIFLHVYQTTEEQSFVQMEIEHIYQDVYEQIEQEVSTMCKHAYTDNKLTCKMQIDE